jgi:hypothetical protein
MLGMLDRIGTLAPGKQADLVVIRADDLNMQPVHDPVSAVVFQASAGQHRQRDGGRPMAQARRAAAGREPAAAAVRTARLGRQDHPRHGHWRHCRDCGMNIHVVGVGKMGLPMAATCGWPGMP